ncbi:hypothetical protein [Rathayibacter iranicus]|uniref:hypothetical protein n=1 Tax=Rathayibacter iranicus TaxID=59737 RepID=UPI001F4E8382|nr:hypothetical protein [Rathayibacter iranicus]
MSGGDEVDEVAAVVQRLAVLLAAGVAPGSALGHLAAAGARGAGRPVGVACCVPWRRRRLAVAMCRWRCFGDVRPHDGRPARQAVV